MYFIKQGMSDGDNEQRSLNKDNMFVKEIAPELIKQFSRGHGESESCIRISIRDTKKDGARLCILGSTCRSTSVDLHVGLKFIVFVWESHGKQFFFFFKK